MTESTTTYRDLTQSISNVQRPVEPACQHAGGHEELCRARAGRFGVRVEPGHPPGIQA
jgi:hypothetical protein